MRTALAARWRVDAFVTEVDAAEPHGLVYLVSVLLCRPPYDRVVVYGAGATYDEAYRDALGVAVERGLVLEMESDGTAAR